MADTDIYPGDYVVIAAVSDYGTTNESEEFVGKVKDDITATADFETAESNLKDEPYTQRDRTHRSFDLEFVLVQSPGIPALDVLGITGSSSGGNLTGDKIECLRFYIYRDDPPEDGNKPGSNHVQVKEYFAVQPAIDEDTLPTGDHATISITAFVGDGWAMGKQARASS